jgi:DNA-directed RNA polymerase subunit RPC12/RpoP
MKKFIKNNWHILLLSLLAIATVGAFALGVNFGNMRADSGWDSSYGGGGGGGSWSSGGGGGGWSSGGGSWSSSSHSSSSYSGNYSGSYTEFLITLAFWALIIFLVIATSNKNAVKSTPTKGKIMRADISNEEIKKILPDESLGSLKHMAFETFVAIQNAWMNFDYDGLRKLCTDELYNTYVAQLDTLKLKNGKNIMTAFDNEEIRIIGIKEENKIVTVEVYLRVTFYDYVINDKTKEVIRGTKDQTLTNNYEMQFVRTKHNKKKKVKCPNCGAEVNTVVSSTCEYCGSTIVVNANEFVLSKKTNINKY